MQIVRSRWLVGSALVLGASFVAAGCYTIPTWTSDSERSPAPLRMPAPERQADCGCYEDSLTGGQIFSMYCSYCHEAPSLAERPFAQFRNVATHMRVRANLTGKEYDKLVEWLRRWHDVPAPNPPVEPSPKRLIFSQPMNELRDEKPAAEEAPKPMPVEPPKGPLP